MFILQKEHEMNHLKTLNTTVPHFTIYTLYNTWNVHVKNICEKITEKNSGHNDDTVGVWY